MKHLMKTAVMFVLLSLFCVMAVTAAKWTDAGNYDITWYLDNPSAKEVKISGAKQLAGVAFLVNNGYSNFEGVNIRLEKSFSLDGAEWDPIGTPSRPFEGNLIGSGFTIADLTVKGKNKYSGLVGYASGSNFEHLNINIKRVNYTTSSSYNELNVYVGGLIGYAKECSFYNIYLYDETDNNLSVSCDTYGCGSGRVLHYVGGVAGSAYDSSFEYCTAILNIRDYLGYWGSRECHESGSQMNVGGIVGHFSGSGKQINSIRNCVYSRPYWYMESVSKMDCRYRESANTNNMESRIGSIAGYASSESVIQFCHSDAQIKTAYAGHYWNRRVGGIVGEGNFYKGGIYNCYFAGDIDATGCERGGIAAYYNSDNLSHYVANYSLKRYTDYNGYNGSTVVDMTTAEFTEELNIWPRLNGYGKIWVGNGHLPSFAYDAEEYVCLLTSDDEDISTAEIVATFRRIKAEDYSYSVNNIEMKKYFWIIGTYGFSRYWFFEPTDGREVEVGISKPFKKQSCDYSDTEIIAQRKGISWSKEVGSASIIINRYDQGNMSVVINETPEAAAEHINSYVPQVEIFYDLNGNKIVNPHKGSIYILKNNKGVSKIIF